MQNLDALSFRKSVEYMEDTYGIVDCVYIQCIEEFSQIALTALNDKVRNRILVPFLFDWGKMQRHLGFNGLDATYNKIREKTFRQKIEPLRKENLRSTNLEKLERQIVHLFDDFSMTEFKGANDKPKTLGSTTASKVLHLCCPDFFIMWDADIKYGNGDGGNYLRFLTDMKNLWIKLDSIIIQLEKTYNKRATRIIDEFNWYECHPSER